MTDIPLTTPEQALRERCFEAALRADADNAAALAWRMLAFVKGECAEADVQQP